MLDAFGYRAASVERVDLSVRPGSYDFGYVPLQHNVLKGYTAFCPLSLVVLNNGNREVTISKASIENAEVTGEARVERVYYLEGEYQSSTVEFPFKLEPGEHTKIALWFELELPPAVSELISQIPLSDLGGGWTQVPALQLDMTIWSHTDLLGNVRGQDYQSFAGAHQIAATAVVETARGNSFHVPISWIPHRILNGTEINLWDAVMSTPPLLPDREDAI